MDECEIVVLLAKNEFWGNDERRITIPDVASAEVVEKNELFGWKVTWSNGAVSESWPVFSSLREAKGVLKVKLESDRIRLNIVRSRWSPTGFES